MKGVVVARKHHKPDEIVAKLRQVEVLLAQGKTATEAVRTLWLTEPTYCRWRAEYGGLKLDQVKRLQLLEQENCRLRKAVADLTLEKLVSAARRRGCVEHVTAKLGVSQRLACRVPPPEAMPLAAGAPTPVARCASERSIRHLS